MSRGRLGSILFVVAFALAVVGAFPEAEAQAPSTDPTTTTSLVPITTHEEQLRRMSCRFTPGVRESDPSCVYTDGPVPEDTSPSGWTVFFAVVVWVAIPMGLAVAIAASRDESIVIAAVLTLVLGWIGLVLVYGFLGRVRRNEAVSAP